MLLSITSTTPPATDLGYLLHKNPARPQWFDLAFGRALVFYPEATYERCTAALMLDVDPIELVRGAGHGSGPLSQYVNDRPYAASSLLSVAIARVLASARGGRCKERPQLAATPLPLVAELPVLPCRGGEDLLRRLFEPLGYGVEATRLPLDERFPEWGDGRYYRVRLSAIVRVAQLLSHLYVLIPVLDNEKHYYVGAAEVEKLLDHGMDWLPRHPEKELIARRYLIHRRSLVNDALARLTAGEAPADPPDDMESQTTIGERRFEEKLRLNDVRMQVVADVLREKEAHRVLDLGCGEGSLLRVLLRDRSFEEMVGMDVSSRALEIAAERLRLDRLPPKQRARVKLLQGSLIYRDRRLEGYDAAAVVEVIEHLDPPRLATFERVVFEFARPLHVIVTTPNVEYNRLYPHLLDGRLRHRDHRFEWTREEFRAWAEATAARFSFSVELRDIGEVAADLGPPTQMAVFSRRDEAAT